jgi:hypothetical protein
MQYLGLNPGSGRQGSNAKVNSSYDGVYIVDGPQSNDPSTGSGWATELFRIETAQHDDDIRG